MLDSILIILGYIFLINIIYNLFKKQTSLGAKHYNLSNLDNKCKIYLQSIRSDIRTSNYGMMSGAICGLISYIIFKLLQKSIQLTDEHVIFISFFTFIITFTTTYKVCGCLITRELCPTNCPMYNIK